MFPDEVSAFLERGGTLSWGLIPSSDDLVESETSDGLVKMFKESISALVKKGIDEDVLIRRSMITPQCGLGGMYDKNADKALNMLYETSEALKKYYGVSI
jgi:hypothetical protein